MNTIHLQYILEIHRSGSINKASQNLYISQSHLSNIIKSIEDEIGYAIFSRGASGTNLTQEGQVFLKHAKEILEESEKIKNVPQIFVESHNLSVVASRASFLFHCFFDFIHTFPFSSAKDTVLGAGLQENLRNIVTQRCRLGVLVMFKQKQEKYKLLCDRYNINFQVLKDNIPMMAFIPKNHPLSSEDSITVSKLSKYPFIVDADIDDDDTLDILNIEKNNKVLLTCDLAAVLSAVHRGQYISIGINVSKKDANLYDFICRSVVDAEEMSVCLINNKNIPLSKREIDFIKYLTNSLHQFYG